jgi:hypothetical protein
LQRPTPRQPFFKVGDLVRVATSCLPSDPLDTKLSPRYLGPFRIIEHPSPNVYEVDFGDKLTSSVHRHLNADTLRPYFQASQALLRMDKDLPPIGTQKGHPIHRGIVLRIGTQKGHPIYRGVDITATFSWETES